jgi:HlyD family secretion protein
MVHQMSVFTIGGVVAPGASILQIVPTHEAVEVEVQVATQAIDEVYVGQPARARFTAFNQRTTPELAATVQTISPSSVFDERLGTSYYRVWLRLDDVELAKLGGQTLVPGMPVEVFIKTRDRTALSYLVKPLSDQINRAFREE